MRMQGLCSAELPCCREASFDTSTTLAARRASLMKDRSLDPRARQFQRCSTPGSTNVEADAPRPHIGKTRPDRLFAELIQACINVLAGTLYHSACQLPQTPDSEHSRLHRSPCASSKTKRSHKPEPPEALSYHGRADTYPPSTYKGGAIR